MSKLKSFRVFSKDSGKQVMTIIASDEHISLKEWNELLQNGMSVVMVDERSALVKGVNYDCT